MSIRLFDTHAHLDDKQFDSQRPALITRALNAGVEHIVCVGTTAESSHQCSALSQQFPSVLAAAGIQPNYVHEAKSDDWDEIVRLCHSGVVSAIGETGLDRYWDFAPFALQEDYFDRHIRLSQSTGLPFIVHMRDCDEDVLRMLRRARQRSELRGVMHSFTGRQDTVDECLSLGMYISFAGMVTYPKSELLRQIATRVPLDRLLIETDSPYLSPHPVRGHRPNEPSLIVHTASCLAETLAIPLPELARCTFNNACELFRVAKREASL